MRRWLVLMLLCTCVSHGQGQPSVLDDLVPSVQQWMRENLDDSVLAALDRIDQDRVRELFGEMQRRLQSDYVYDLGALRSAANQVTPLLQRFEETRPYAVWLRTRLDYLEAASELERRMQPAAPKRGALAPLPAPSSQLQTSVWRNQFAQRPTPNRAQKYVPQLKPIFVAEKVPAPLVWIAEVESSFDPTAQSPAGATGLFQLMPATAKSLGLSTRLPDERLSPEKSARAAAKYLRHLHERFGDWRLALAAYNAGESHVETLLKKSRVRTFEAIAHRLPSETQMYVPKCEAALRKREGVSLSELKLPKG